MDKQSEFEEVVKEYWPSIYGLARRMMRSEAEAEELTQQTFFQAYRAWDRFEERSAIQTWLYRIAINACKRAFREREKGITMTPEDQDRIADEQHTDEKKNQKRQLLAQAMESLRPPQRLLLNLFCIENLSHKEIAAIYGIPEGTIWSRLYTAKKSLESIITISYPELLR